MSLVPSLLQAIVQVDGDVLVLHPGDKPYVVAPGGQIDLATRGMATDTIEEIVSQLLPPDSQRVLDSAGAVQHELPTIEELPQERFTVVAARGHGDLWVEVRRRRPDAPKREAEPAAVRSAAAPSQPAVVLPMTRPSFRVDAPPGDPMLTPDFDRLLRTAAARGASALYLSSDAKPSIRVDGELHTLDGELPLSARDLESLLMSIVPERTHEALRGGPPSEWISEIDGVGRVRCVIFRDHRGPGGVFRLMPARTVSAEQLGLSAVVQRLAIEPEGLVVFAGPRSSGRRTLVAGFVDLVARGGPRRVITVEREIQFVHESASVSQREVRGGDDEVLAVARAALREDPDVLVIADLRTAALAGVAFEAAQRGHLVVAGFSAHTATAAVDRRIDRFVPEQRRQVQFALADTLRGIVAQVLLKKPGGGRIAAREVMLNTPAVSGAIADGRTSQLPLAIEGGRRYGMLPLNDSLLHLMKQQAVDGREAWRYAFDRPGLLAALKQQGLDVSFAEKLA
jgi:twitching motility protein PilT